MGESINLISGYPGFFCSFFFHLFLFLLYYWRSRQRGGREVNEGVVEPLVFFFLVCRLYIGCPFYFWYKIIFYHHNNCVRYSFPLNFFFFAIFFIYLIIFLFRLLTTKSLNYLVKDEIFSQVFWMFKDLEFVVTSK